MKHYNGLYLMGNYPDPDTFVKAALRGLEYFDFLEVGIPFSDPVADGPVIMNAGQHSIARGETLDTILKSVDVIRSKMNKEKKIYLMHYANTAHKRGYAAFCERCAASGISGLIVPDMPFGESDALKSEAAKFNISFVHFVTTESSEQQIDEIAKSAGGFVYAISMRGITGQKLEFTGEIKEKIAQIKARVSCPVVLGFGIKDVEQAQDALTFADGFIMGTRPVELITRGFEAFDSFIGELERVG